VTWRAMYGRPYPLALLNRAHVLGIVSREFYRPLMSVAVLSLIATPLLNFRLLPRLLRALLSLPAGRGLHSSTSQLNLSCF